MFEIGKEERQLARDLLMQEDEARDLLTHERKAWPGEGEEPDLCP